MNDWTFVTEVAEIARDLRVAHLTQKAHILADLTVVSSVLLPRLVVNNLDVSVIGIEDDTVGATTGLELTSYDSTLIEDLSSAIKPVCCLRMLHHCIEALA